MFVGSSVESIEVARAVQSELAHDVDVTLWGQGIFALSRATLNDLLDATREHDYAAFILAPDDIATIRDQTESVPRDNVMFELGLFFGGLGAERCFFLMPQNVKDFHIPTDLAGIAPGNCASEVQPGPQGRPTGWRRRCVF
jgi:predicted nucleotide-binding protein